MNPILEILESAISDVGAWCWWEQALPKTFQVEFIGTQLWNPPSADGEPPSGQIGLRFTEPSSISFISRLEGDKGPPGNWADLLHRGRIEPLAITFDQFILQDSDRIGGILARATSIQTVHGKDPSEVDFSSENATLAFWAGNVGLIVAAAEMGVVNQQGVVAFEQIEVKFDQWWKYWHKYWDAKKVGSPLPEDYSCEVTIPIKGHVSQDSSREIQSIYQCPKCGSHNSNKLSPTCGTLWGAP